MKQVFAVGLILLLSFTVVQAEESVEFKSVTLKVFMQDRIEGTYPIRIPVPVEYEAAQISMAPSSYSYWMRQTDVRRANKKGELPEKNGFMYGKLSINVGYDRDKDTFLGIEEPKYLQEAENDFSNILMERTSVGEHAILLLRMTEKTSDTHMYGMYFATNIDTNVVYVAYRPVNNSKGIGDLFLERVNLEIEKSNAALKEVMGSWTGPVNLAGKVMDGLYTSPSDAFSCRVPPLGNDWVFTDQIFERDETVTIGVRGAWLHRVDYLAVGENPIAWYAGRDDESSYLRATMQRLVEYGLKSDFKKVDILEQNEVVIDDTKALYSVVFLKGKNVSEKRGFLVFLHEDHVAILHVRLGHGKGPVNRIYPEMLKFYQSCEF